VQAHRDEFQSRASGSTFPEISRTKVKAIPILLPPLGIQRRIVDFIGALDVQVEGLSRELQAARIVHEALGEALVVGPMVKVKEIAEASRGLVGGPFGSLLTTKDYTTAGVPVIRGTNMPKIGRFIGGDFVHVSLDKAASLPGNLAKPGDVIFTQRGTLGQVGLVPESHPLFVISQSQMRLRVDQSRAMAEYVYFAFARPSVVRGMQQQNTATANPHINLGILGKQDMPLPDLAEQARVVDVLLSSSASIEALHGETGALQALRRIILRTLLDGAVEIPETYDLLLPEAV